MDRRDFLLVAGSVATTLTTGTTLAKAPTMYGLIGKMTAVPGQRDLLPSILLEGIHRLPGCLNYVDANDPTDADSIWITEVWDSEQSHQASLSLPIVRQAIARAKPLIAAFG
ncbi:MAG TPA: putative quinol monooxygenase, partial [Povalibacter sp.]